MGHGVEKVFMSTFQDIWQAREQHKCPQCGQALVHVRLSDTWVCLSCLAAEENRRAPTPVSVKEAVREEREERAAIMEYNGKLKRGATLQ